MYGIQMPLLPATVQPINLSLHQALDADAKAGMAPSLTIVHTIPPVPSPTPPPPPPSSLSEKDTRDLASLNMMAQTVKLASDTVALLERVALTSSVTRPSSATASLPASAEDPDPLGVGHMDSKAALDYPSFPWDTLREEEVTPTICR